MSVIELCGYKPNPRATEAILADAAIKTVREWRATDQRQLMQNIADETVLLYEPLFMLHPQWKRFAQGIGDCVSWGWELVCTILQATSIVLNKSPWEWKGEFATEPIYGGSRVESNGGRLGGYSDGSYGAAAAKWVTQWGMLLRQNYSITTGNNDHDLTTYSSKKAKRWGHYGCGGKDDRRGDGKLDLVAKEHPCETAAMVRSFQEAAPAIQNGYPIAVCSTRGFTRKRDKDGFCRPSGMWPHCMAFIGVRFGARPGLLCANSWGVSNSGPTFPEDMPKAVADCSFWVDANVVDSMLRGGDSFAVSDLVGFRRRDIDWKSDFILNV